jgi:PQQ-dependent dehydrogenase (methanol/ethanol family)
MSRPAPLRRAFVSITLAAAAVTAAAQDPHPAAPGPTPAASEGARLFAANCTTCHGADAKGARGPSLVRGEWKYGSSVDEIARNIHDGIPGTEMPAFPLPADESRAIAEWLLSLNLGPDDRVSGDASAGRGLFFGAGGCSACHAMQGSGGSFGPDLTGIGAQRSARDLTRAITSPGDNPRGASKGAEVQMPDGKRIRGVIVGEDTFSLYLRDREERLHLLAKSNIRSRQDVKTLMPAASLNADQVNNLVAFLKAPAGAERDLTRWKPAADFNVTWARLRNSAAEPWNWLHYWGDLQGTHYSTLKSITPANVPKLAAQWTFQFGASGIETSPIVADGLMFVTGPRDNAAALDARTGFPIWRYRRTLPAFHANCTVSTNRGFAILGDRLYLGTLDAHLVALDARTGRVVFDVAVADYQKGFSITHAPLVVDGKIIVGVTAGECALYGFLDAYDAVTGKRLWRVQAIPQPGDPARQTWSGDSAEFGGGPTWMTGTYDPETDTIFWGTGNPSPDYDGSVRLGDNLYTDSVLALDPATGRIKWYFQFTPHDTHDWDSSETPVILDATFQGKPRKLLIQANRNAFYYVLDRETGEFLLGKPFTRQTWADGLNPKGRPIVIHDTDPTPEGNYVCPDATGGTNWDSPSYDPLTKLFFVGARDSCATYKSIVKKPVPGLPYTGTGDQADESVGAKGVVTAIEPLTGNIRWKFPLQNGSASAGVLATGGGVLFAGSRDGYLIGLDARTGKLLWKYQTGTEIRSSPIAYAIDGRQYIAISNDSSLTVFALAAN